MFLFHPRLDTGARHIIPAALAAGLFLLVASVSFSQGVDPQQPLRASMERYAYSKDRFTFEAGYGSLQFAREGFSGSLPLLGLAEARWGFSAINPLKDDMAQLDERFALGGYMRPRWAPRGGSGNAVQGDFWRLGVGIRDGYAYWPGRVMILPYFLWTFNWSRWNAETNGLSPVDSSIVARYSHRICFGLNSESGLRLQFGWHASLSAGYEFGLIYPRVVFPEWVGSFAVISTAEGVTGVFTKGILRDAPWLTPILHALLKGGFAYGYYRLTQSNMNWPFHSETPLTYAGWKVALSYRF